VRPGDILSHTEMCQMEGMMLQKGMTFRAPPNHGIILMSQRPNAPYEDAMDDDNNLLYEGHDAPRTSRDVDPKTVDQPRYTTLGRATENGKFADWTDRHKAGEVPRARFRVYEKLQKGIWSFKGTFLLKDYRLQRAGQRLVFKFMLTSVDEDEGTGMEMDQSARIYEAETRQIPTWVKQYVFKRDKGRCVECGAEDKLHFDHDLPFSKGGASANPSNVKLLCARHNLSKGARIL
jgi:hypothetical protein